MSASSSSLAPEAINRLLQCRHHDPFELLGKHQIGDQELIRALIPGAESVYIDESHEMSRTSHPGIFEWRGPTGLVPERYRLTWLAAGIRHSAHDPYCFTPQLTDFDLHLFAEGTHRRAHTFLGAHPRTADEITGVLFAVWAPNAERVSVVGDFNAWDGRRHPMRVRGSGGVWELFIPDLAAGEHYKFEIRNRDTGRVALKCDPYARHCERRPQTASIVVADSEFSWHDAAWMRAREQHDWLHQPMAVYECHLASWRRAGDNPNKFTGYREIAVQLVDYVQSLGFTHIELLPITEHPLDASWGYQTTGYFAPTSRFGTPDDFRFFVDHCHQHHIGVLLDWAPAHFPRDDHGLAGFDGAPLYEHQDPTRGEHRDWGTLIFDYGRHEVQSFLVSSAIYWLHEYHLDGLRVDAVASMLYLDYSRDPGEWTPNQFGGNENLDAIDFLRQLNESTHAEQPGTLMIAEESTAWPQVTRPTWVGGLGFDMKWNLGWMNDTLEYFSKDPVHRSFHHDRLTFGLIYGFSENFVLPFSHDEVVHEKRSLLGKMPGDEWQRMANLRLLYTYQWTYPGKKLLFMGGELAQAEEWNDAAELAWENLSVSSHRGVHRLIGDLNRVYKEQPALHRHDFDSEGFEWIDCHDSKQSVIAYLRVTEKRVAVVALNFTPVPRHRYRIGVPCAGDYVEVLNSDAALYGGTDVGNLGHIRAESIAWMGRTFSLQMTLPPLAGVILVCTAAE